MPRPRLHRIFANAVMHDHFLCRGLDPDCTGDSGASPLLKVVASLLYLAYGSPADSLDVRLGETTALHLMKHFCWSVVQQFIRRHLRAPTASEHNEIARLKVICEMDIRIWCPCLGFPGSTNDLNV